MKKVAFVVNTSWHTYNFRLGLIKSFQRQGYEVVAISPKDDFSQKLIDQNIKHYDIKINNIGTNPFEDAMLTYNYYKLYKEIKPDLVMHFTAKPNIYGSIAAKMLGIPAISSITGLGTIFLHDSFALRVAKMIYKFALKIPQKVFFENPNDRDLFVEQGFAPKEKTVLAPGCGINTEHFKPALRDGKIEEKKEVKFLLVARLIKDKGLVEYIEAIRILKAKYQNAKFSILGSFYPENPTAITEETMAAWQKEGVVEYLGTTEDVKSVIDNQDCIVLPSYREGLSRVLLEAASMAKPIVTTDVPGCRDVVEDGVTGFVCQERDAVDLAAKMEQVLTLREEERIEMGAKAREKIIREFDEKLVVALYVDVVKKLFRKGASRDLTFLDTAKSYLYAYRGVFAGPSVSKI